MSVRLSAGGAGLQLAASSLANTKRSRGVAAQPAFFTWGIAGLRMGWKDQCDLRCSATSLASAFGLSPAGQGAPIFTHADKASIASTGSLPSGGILILASWRTARMIGLL